MNTTSYPAVLDTIPPVRFDRAQVFLRLLLLVLLAAIGMPFGGLLGLLYLALPALAAAWISQRGAPSFFGVLGPRVVAGLRWVLAIYAYLAFLTDRLPTRPADLIRYEVAPEGAPNAKSALLRVLASLPEALVLVLLWMVAAVAWVLAAVWILASRTYPAFIYGFMRGVLRYSGRLFAYHASLVEQYPPFVFDTGPEPTPPPMPMA